MFRNKPRPEYVGTDNEKRCLIKWRELACSLTKHGIDPRRYIRWAYIQLRPTLPIILVNHITSDKLVQQFVVESPAFLEREWLLTTLRLLKLSQELKAGRTAEEVARDELLDLGDTVRYALARKLGIDDLATALRKSAALDIANEPVIREVLSGFLD